MLTIRGSSSTEYPVLIPGGDTPAPQLDLSDYHSSWYAEPLPVPPRDRRPTPEWNTLVWPIVGASRYAECHLLIDGETWAALSGDTNVTLTFDDGDGGVVTAACRIISAVPVSDSRGVPGSATAGNESLAYELLVSDLRYDANRPVTTATAPATWGDLISRLYNLATGNTISASVINAKVHADYGAPPAVFAYTATIGRSAAAVLDAACAAVNLRVVFAPDGNQWFQNAADGVAFPHAGDLHTGGFVALERAATLRVTSYGASNTTSTVSVSGGTGATEVWLPYTGAGVTRFGVDYGLWQTGDVPDGWFVGFKSLPLNARLDRWVLRGDVGTTGFTRGVEGWPFPLVGSTPTVPVVAASVPLNVFDNSQVPANTPVTNVTLALPSAGRYLIGYQTGIAVTASTAGSSVYMLMTLDSKPAPEHFGSAFVGRVTVAGTTVFENVYVTAIADVGGPDTLRLVTARLPSGGGTVTAGLDLNPAGNQRRSNSLFYIRLS